MITYDEFTNMCESDYVIGYCAYYNYQNKLYSISEMSLGYDDGMVTTDIKFNDKAIETFFIVDYTNHQVKK